MSLPFSADAFFDVFARYNLALWPVAVALWLGAAAAVLAIVTSPRPGADRLVVIVLVALWAWGGAVYHAAYFTAINPAAWAFALLFLVQAGLLSWSGLVRRQLLCGSASSIARLAGAWLAFYALAYPGLSIAAGHPYPATPTFGVPCPTTIFTVGVLLMCRRPPLTVSLIPLVWSLIGGSAAVLLGVTVDYVLLACAPILGAHLWHEHRTRRQVDMKPPHKHDASEETPRWLNHRQRTWTNTSRDFHQPCRKYSNACAARSAKLCPEPRRRSRTGFPPTSSTVVT